MLNLRNMWRRHRRKVFVCCGLFGGGYLLYKLYNAHRQRLDNLERELASERKKVDGLIKDQMQAHFENIQRIADTTTLQHAMQFLSSRIEEELELSHLTDRLMKGKDQQNTLTSSEKLELWDQLKILSFTRLVLSMWAMTILSLYIRVQVNILGRHLYIDTARHLGSSQSLDDGDLIDNDDQQKFLASADFLSAYGLPTLISDMQTAVTQVLKGKQLRDFFNTTVLRETVMQILETFKSIRSSHLWVNYLMPEDARLHKLATDSSSDDAILSGVTKFDQLMVETRAVLSSAKFVNVAETALAAVVDTLIEEMGAQCGGDNLASGMPLARLLARVAQMGPILLEEPSKNQFIQTIQNVQEVEVLFTLLYSYADLTD
ncbi:hypothetical protein UlMin_008821 [Ulmus minor]